MANAAKDGTLYQDHESRIGSLEQTVGAIPNPDQYTDKNDVRAITGYQEGDRVLCLENNYVYVFDPAATATDNDDTVLTPDDITEPAAGRWLRLLEFSVVGHNHDNRYMQFAVSVTGSRFVTLDPATKQVVETTYGPNSWVSTDTYNDFITGAFANLEQRVTDAEQAISDIDLSGKMDVLSPTAGQVDNILTIGSNGQPQISGTKTTDLVTKSITVNITVGTNHHDLNIDYDPGLVQIYDATGVELVFSKRKTLNGTYFIDFNSTKAYQNAKIYWQ